MKINRTRNSIRNIYFGFLNKFVTIICPFAIRTIMIRTLGAEYLGINSLFTSVLQVLSISELGFGTAMVYSMYEPIAKDNDEEICALLALYQKIYRIIGISIILMGAVLIPFLPRFITGGTPSDVNINLLFLIYLFNSSVGYLFFAYRNSLFVAFQRNDIESNILTIAKLVLSVFQIAVLLTLRNYYVYIILLPLSTLAVNIIEYIISKKMFRKYIPHGRVSFEKMKDIKVRVLALFGHKLGGVVVNSADNIVISAFLGLSTLAVYNNYYYIMNAIVGFLDIAYASMRSGVGNSISTESKAKNLNDFNFLVFFNSWITLWSTICLICLLQPIMLIWMGKNYMFDFSTVLLIGCYFYVLNIRKVVLLFKDARGIWKEDALKPFISSAINLVVNIILVKYIGINGILLSTIISIVLIDTPWELWSLKIGYFKEGLLNYIYNLVINFIFGIILLLLTYKCCTLVGFSSIYINFIVKGVICAILPNVIYFILHIRNPYLYRGICLIKRKIKK